VYILKTNRICVIQELSPYRAVNPLHFGYKKQSVTYVLGKSSCLFWESYKAYKCDVISKQNFLMLNLVVRIVTSRL